MQYYIRANYVRRRRRTKLQSNKWISDASMRREILWHDTVQKASTRGVRSVRILTKAAAPRAAHTTPVTRLAYNINLCIQRYVWYRSFRARSSEVDYSGTDVSCGLGGCGVCGPYAPGDGQAARRPQCLPDPCWHWFPCNQQYTVLW